MPSMKRYLREHEEFVKGRIGASDSSGELNILKEYHLIRIKFMQHERLIHLLVTLAFGLFMFILLLAAPSAGWHGAAIPAILILILVVYYIFHYYLLENGVQRWYLLTDEIDRLIEEYKK